MYHIWKIHCQQVTLKYITPSYQIPVLQLELISLHYFEFVSNKHSMFLQSRAPL